MCTELFGDISKDVMEPGQFDSPPAKKLQAEADIEEAKVGEALGAPNPSASITRVYTDHIPINLNLGMPTDSLLYFEAEKVQGKGGCKQTKNYCLHVLWPQVTELHLHHDPHPLPF